MKIDLTPTTTLTLEQAFQLGVNTYQEGKKTKAREIFESILEKAPEAIDVLQVLAVLDADDGNYKVAENKLRKALSLSPNDIAIKLDLAHTLKLQGLNIEALSVLDEILSLSPQHQGALQLQGEIHQATGNRSQSQQSNKALQQAEHHKKQHLDHEIHKTLETVAQLLAGKHFQPAEQLLQSMLLLSPNHLDLHLKLATVYALQEKYTNAVHQLKSALSLNPHNENIALMIIKLYRETKQYNEGIKTYKDFISQGNKPSFETKKLFAELSLLSDEFHTAFVESKKLLSTNPKDKDLLWIYALASYKKVHTRQNFDLKSMEKAERSLEFAMQANIKDHGRAVQISKALFDLNYYVGNFEVASTYLNRIEKDYPDDSKVLWNKHILHNYNHDWENYYYAFEKGIESGDRLSYNPNKPFWTPLRPSTDTVLVLREQGVGDELYFCHNLNYLIQRVDKVYFACDERLIPLINSSFPTVETIAIKPNSSFIRNQIPLKLLEKVDSWLPIGSIKQHIYNDSQQHWLDESCVTLPLELQNEWEQKVQYDRNDDSLKIGISWRSGLRSSVRNAHYLSLNELAHFMKQFPNATFYNLQYGDCQKELKKIKQLTGIDVINFEDLDLKDDFLSTAALMNNLDAVFSCGNAVFRLAVAAGVPSYVYYAREQSDDFTQQVALHGEGNSKRHEHLFAYPPLLKNKYPLVESIANQIKSDFA
ncbi:tetratricopeptide repeat protein [Photobacterium sp. BZF1]|uniref:tetratricopeptide repeat protein n=1 Tax=Photobacterium sp. BZF1 TaxID=1904457 RepID=UPI001653B489|nr:tetratricopeptide repeat protein [Photobacterium sp. BZF1]MBC7001986.1 tetratricopeptide repeat protein [Photobacterium sp. BZF1]